jgi:hypothetical protein
MEILFSCLAILFTLFLLWLLIDILSS